MPLETNLDQRLAADAEDVKAERRLKEAVRRYYALAELIDTERGYVDDLKILVEVSETFHSARLVLFSFPRSFHIFFLVPCCGAMFCSPPHGCVYAYHPHICAGNVLSRRDLDPGTGDKPSEMRFASRECFSSILVFHTFPFRHRAFPLFVRLPTQRRRPHKQTASWWQRQLFHAIISTFHHHCTIGYAVAFARQPLPQQLMAPIIMQWARLLGTEYLAALGSGNTGVC